MSSKYTCDSNPQRPAWENAQQSLPETSGVAGDVRKSTVLQEFPQNGPDWSHNGVTGGAHSSVTSRSPRLLRGWAVMQDLDRFLIGCDIVRAGREVPMRRTAIGATLILAGVIAYGVAAHGQSGGGAKADPVKVDPKHYKVEFENESVRVLRISYGPGEKSVMHYHPNSVAVFLTDGMTRMTTPDGKSQDVPGKAGAASWGAAGNHLPQNVGSKPFEVVVVELKK